MASSTKLAAPAPSAGDLKDFTASIDPGTSAPPSSTQGKTESKHQDVVAQSTASAMQGESVQSEVLMTTETLFESEPSDFARAAKSTKQGNGVTDLADWQRIGASDKGQAAFREAFRPARGLRQSRSDVFSAASSESNGKGADLEQELSTLMRNNHLSAMGRSAQRLR